MEDAARTSGLQVNIPKTNYMVMARDGARNQNQNLVTGSAVFEKVPTFKYLGSLISEQNDNTLEIKERIAAGNRAYFSTIHLLKSKSLSRKHKKIIYKTVIRPVVMYGCETWVLTIRSKDVLNTWERKILRKIYGPVQENGGWRVRTNQELYELYEDPCITNEVKSARLRWLGHVERMPENRAVRQVFRNHPQGRRLPGRPRKRWLEDVEEDLLELKVRGWRRCALDRAEWRKVVDQARALHGL
jgi:hypothetical protein